MAALGPGAEKVTIGVVIDGETDWRAEGIGLIEKELNTLLKSGKPEVVFKCAPEFDAKWQPEAVRPAFEAAFRDPEVDIVMTLGMLSAALAAAPDFELLKPTVNAFVDEAEILGLKIDEKGGSSKKNLNYVAVPLRARRDLEALKSIVDYKTVGVAVDSLLLEHVPAVPALIKEAENEERAKIAVIPFAESAQAALDAIPAGLDAIYLTSALRMSRSEWLKLIRGINERKIPSFSMNGRVDVEGGVLAGIWPDHTGRLARRLALNLQMIMDGEPAERLPVYMHLQEELVLNAATAEAIGFRCPTELLITAVLINSDSLAVGRLMPFAEAMSLALERNAELGAARAAVKVSDAERKMAMSAFLPQVNAVGQYSRVDEDRAEASFGSVPKEKTTAGGSITQVIFNDGVFSRYRMAGRALAAAESDRESQRLDVMEQAGKAYIQYLQAIAIVRVESDTLEMTRNNLMLARLRRELGAVGPEETLRWEAEAAVRKASFLRAVSEAEMARTQVNRILNIEQGALWKPEELNVGADGYYFLGGRLGPLVSDWGGLDKFNRFVVRRAIEVSPVLRALDRRIEALEIQLAQARRRFIAPEAAMSFTYDRILNQTQAGGMSAGMGVPAVDDDEWMFAAQVSYPLFEGGARLFAVKRAAAELEQLRFQREHARLLVEQQARNVFFALESSFPAMRLQREAADAAGKNLDVIREKYGVGAVGILSLLDAQNQSFVANQQAAAAVYTYLSNLIELQRVLCWFEWEKSEEEKDAFAAAAMAGQ